MPRKMPSHLSSMHSILPKSLQHLGITEQVKFKRIWRAWLDVIGSHITNHARPFRLSHRTLVVRVNHASWLQEIGYHKGSFIMKLNDVLGHPLIEDLHLELGELPPLPLMTPPRSGRPSWMEQELPEEWEQEIEQKLAHIPEGDIKDTARRIMANQIKLNRLATEK